VHISTKRSDVNTRKKEGEGRATSLQRREVNVTASVAACTVGGIVYTDRHTDIYTDKSTNLIISSNLLRSIGRDNNTDSLTDNIKEQHHADADLKMYKKVRSVIKFCGAACSIFSWLLLGMFRSKNSLIKMSLNTHRLEE